MNRPLDGPTAREIAEGSFEAVVAPGYDEAARRILAARPELEVLLVPPNPADGLRDYGIAALDFKRVAAASSWRRSTTPPSTGASSRW